MAFVATIAFVAASATVALGFIIADSNVIFPNVSAEGIDLSGMTVVEANHMLVSMGFEDNAASVSVTVNFPDGSSFSISGSDAGLSLNAEAAALAAFEHGRNGTFLGRTFAYVRSFRESTNLNGTSVPILNENFVRGEVAVHTRKFNETLIESSSYSCNGYYITIIPGSGFAPIGEDSLFNQVVEALHASLEQGTPMTVNYTPASNGSEFFDVYALYLLVRTEPVSSEFNHATLTATESIPGISFDVDAAVGKLANARWGEEVIIPLIFTDPEFTADYVQDRLFRDVLAERTTHVAGNANRLHNVTLISSYIDGFVLQPGEIFSFNELTGRRSAEQGYRPAGGFRDGRLVDMIGGGICQVSSSLYDNTLHAYLEVLTRRAHSLPITYLPLGHDAAIYYGVLDLRFRNNTAYPIRIEIDVDYRSLTTRLIGTQTSDYVIRIESRSTATPFQTVYQEDASVAYGQTRVDFGGANGAVAYTYRLIYDAEGNRVSRTRIARDVYRAQNRIVLIPPSGTQPASTDVTSTPETAPELPPVPDTAPDSVPESTPETVFDLPVIPVPTPEPPSIPDSVPESVPETVLDLPVIPIPEPDPAPLPEPPPAESHYPQA